MLPTVLVLPTKQTPSLLSFAAIAAQLLYAAPSHLCAALAAIDNSDPALPSASAGTFLRRLNCTTVDRERGSCEMTCVAVYYQQNGAPRLVCAGSGSPAGQLWNPEEGAKLHEWDTGVREGGGDEEDDADDDDDEDDDRDRDHGHDNGF
jgi:hypothetical protein